jgi:hypothetical protein
LARRMWRLCHILITWLHVCTIVTIIYGPRQSFVIRPNEDWWLSRPKLAMLLWWQWNQLGLDVLDNPQTAAQMSIGSGDGLNSYLDKGDFPNWLQIIFNRTHEKKHSWESETTWVVTVLCLQIVIAAMWWCHYAD